MKPRTKQRTNTPSAKRAAAVVLAVSVCAVGARESGLPDATRLTPVGVVEAQMHALSEWRADDRAASRVFEHASPSNAALTGPLAKFRQMVEQAPYDRLLDNRGWRVGRAVQADGVAVVLVTLIDERGGLSAFRFYLSRQENRGGRWMTDAVIPLPMPVKKAPRVEVPRI